MTGIRFREERERLGWNQDRVAGTARCTRRTVVSWEAGDSPPKADQLSLLADAGFDVYYVLTGQRIGLATTLSARESALVENYRAAPEAGKLALDTTSASLAGGRQAPAAPMQSSVMYSQAIHGNDGQVSQNGDIHVGQAKGGGKRK